MPLNSGEILNNRYRIVNLLGHGGFGAVYRAWDMNLQKSCAVKENLDTSSDLSSQFMREAMTLANLAHQNLPRVIDHFSLPGIGQYMVMDFVEGENLESKVTASGPIPYAQAVAWIGQIADALDYLHHQTQPLIHRDVKPANIIITPNGQAMLVDFGLVKVFEINTKTALGARGITPGYSPPEQYGVGKTDARTDIYALGATLYTLLTGQVPPQSVDIMAGAEKPPTPVHLLNSQIPLDLSQAVHRAMQLDTKQRFQSANEFKAALLSTIPTKVWNTQSSYAGANDTIYQPLPATGTYGGQRPPSSPRPGSQPTGAASQPTGRKGWALFGASGCVIGIILLVLGIAAIWGLYSYTDALAFLKPTATLTPTPVPTHTPVPPTPTATLPPTPTNIPTPTEVPLLTPLPAFFDDFSDPSSGWDRVNQTDVITEYQDNYYRIRVNDTNLNAWANPGLYYTDVIVEVDTYKVGGPTDNLFGVICRYQNNANFYTGVISSDGFGGILHLNNGTFDNLGGEFLEAYDAIILGGDLNHIRFDCIGSTLTLFVNGAFLISVNDSTLTNGDVGLLAGTYSEAGTDMYFDDFSVYVP